MAGGHRAGRPGASLALCSRLSLLGTRLNSKRAPRVAGVVGVRARTEHQWDGEPCVESSGEQAQAHAKARVQRVSGALILQREPEMQIEEIRRRRGRCLEGVMTRCWALTMRECHGASPVVKPRPRSLQLRPLGRRSERHTVWLTLDPGGVERVQRRERGPAVKAAACVKGVQSIPSS